MPFTEEEKLAWHAEKRTREQRQKPIYRSEPVAVCVHCQNPFGISEGIMTDEFALCDICDGD
jgi:hypothetical protein